MERSRKTRGRVKNSWETIFLGLCSIEQEGLKKDKYYIGVLVKSFKTGSIKTGMEFQLVS